MCKAACPEWFISLRSTEKLAIGKQFSFKEIFVFVASGPLSRCIY